MDSPVEKPLTSSLTSSTSRPFFLMIDGMDGSGKTTLFHHIQEQMEQQGKRVFKLSNWQDISIPSFHDIEPCDVYFTAEPTRQWIGAALRNELMQKQVPYEAAEMAQAFALDRHILYRRLIIPALQAGKTIVQDRGVSTSLFYQPIMPNAPTLEEITRLPGNALALKWSPNLLILATLPAEVAHARIAGRDGASEIVFEKISFLKQLESRFKDAAVRRLFMDQGTEIQEINTHQPITEMLHRIQPFIQRLLSSL